MISLATAVVIGSLRATRPSLLRAALNAAVNLATSSGSNTGPYSTLRMSRIGTVNPSTARRWWREQHNSNCKAGPFLRSRLSSGVGDRPTLHRPCIGGDAGRLARQIPCSAARRRVSDSKLAGPIIRRKGPAFLAAQADLLRAASLSGSEDDAKSRDLGSR